MATNTLPEDHPAYIKALSWCPENEAQVQTAFQVYLDLCEVRGWFAVKTHHCSELNVLFLSGKPTLNSQTELILPVDSVNLISPKDITEYFARIKLADTDAREITLAVCDVDSTTVYYKIYNGLVPPESPEETELKRKERFANFQQSRSDIPRYIDQYFENRDTQNTVNL